MWSHGNVFYVYLPWKFCNFCGLIHNCSSTLTGGRTLWAWNIVYVWGWLSKKWKVEGQGARKDNWVRFLCLFLMGEVPAATARVSGCQGFMAVVFLTSRAIIWSSVSSWAQRLPRGSNWTDLIWCYNYTRPRIQKTSITSLRYSFKVELINIRKLPMLLDLNCISITSFKLNFILSEHTQILCSCQKDCYFKVLWHFKIKQHLWTNMGKVHHNTWHQ